MISMPDRAHRPVTEADHVRIAARRGPRARSTRVSRLAQPARARAEDMFFALFGLASVATILYCVVSIWLAARVWPAWDAWVARLNGV